MSEAAPVARIVEIVRTGRRFLITSHARPDGDAIGSQLALAWALRALGKDVRIVNRDPVPSYCQPFPGAGDIEVAGSVDGDFDALFVMECGDLTRPGVAGLDRYAAVNIDHHVGNTGYGIVNWYDQSAAACGELVLDLVDALGVALTPEIAVHLYVAILTDTGSFRHGNMTARTFDLCRRVAAAGVDAAAVARQVYDSSSVGKLKLMGALLDGMQLEAGGRLAVLYLDDGMLRAADSTRDDTEGLINLPLTARDVQAVVMFKAERPDEVRVSLRSKGWVDVRAIAARHGGGGHTNAAGFSVEGSWPDVRAGIVAEVSEAIGVPGTGASSHAGGKLPSPGVTSR
jgi:phosphoesterase RecJ-like protein